MDSNVILYTLNCPKCKVLELKLKKANIEFKIVDDQTTVVNIGKDHNISSAPILQVGDCFLDFAGAVKYINEGK